MASRIWIDLVLEVCRSKFDSECANNTGSIFQTACKLPQPLRTHVGIGLFGSVLQVSAYVELIARTWKAGRIRARAKPCWLA
eukprot:916485-Amphidinium_carterae.1